VRRATGRGFCKTLASVVAISVPLGAAALVSLFGGIDSLGGIRPLYAIQTAVFGGIFVLLLTRLGDSGARSVSGSSRLHVLRDFAQVLRRGPGVVRLLLVMGLMELPWAMTQPFVPLYARDFKGANEFVLGGISVAATVVPLMTAIPLGRLADRHGRKKLIFIIAPLAYGANLCLVFAPRTGVAATPFVLLYGVLFGFNSISMALASSMAAETVSAEQMGRWIGMVNLFRASLAIPAPFVGGLIWEHIGPQYIFFLAIAVDVLMRLPLLASVRETLHPGGGLEPRGGSQCGGGSESAQVGECSR
jgi:Na+/melibiose symporter-like transporter